MISGPGFIPRAVRASQIAGKLRTASRAFVMKSIPPSSVLGGERAVASTGASPSLRQDQFSTRRLRKDGVRNGGLRLVERQRARRPLVFAAMRRSWIIPLLVTSAALVAGCGSPGSSVGSAPAAASPTTSDQRKAVEDAVRSYTSAFLSGDGEKAASLLSQRCNTPALRQQIINAASMAPAMYGQAAIVSVAPVVDGDHATVTYRFNQPAIDQENQPWVNESGAWHYDKC